MAFLNFVGFRDLSAEVRRSVIDAGSASCCLLLSTMASVIARMLNE